MKRKEIFYAIFTGVLLVLAFPGFSLSFTIWFSLIPLLLLIFESVYLLKMPWFKIFVLGWLAGFIFFGGLTYWLLILAKSFGVFGFLAWFLLSAIEALSIGLFALGAAVIAKWGKRWERVLLISAFWVSLEFLRSIGIWGFPWGVLGYSQQSNPVILQVVKLCSVFGLSYLILLVNLMTAELIFAWRKAKVISLDLKEKTSLFRLVSVMIALLFLVVSFGCYSLNQTPSDFPIKVAVIQPSIPQDEKWGSENVRQIKELYYQLTLKSCDENPYLVVWPETAVPCYLFEEDEYFEKIRKLCVSKKIYLLVGSFHQEGRKLYNSAILLSPEGEIVERYDKLYPVLFGEYIPLKPIFGWVGETLGFGEDVSRGKELTVFSTNRGRFSVSICFESTNPLLVRRFVAKGAQMLVAITNDAWFEKTAAARQHVEMTAVQAAENGILTVFAANTGISALIDANGSIFKETELYEEEILVGEVTFVNSPPFYTRFGGAFPYICLFIITLCGFLKFLKTKRKK